MGKLIFVFLMLLVSRADAAFQQTWCTKPLGYLQLTSIAAATNITPVPAGTIYVVISAETQAIRWRDDGVAPTATIGMPVAAGFSFAYTGNFSHIQVIQQTASATVDVYYCGP